MRGNLLLPLAGEAFRENTALVLPLPFLLSPGEHLDPVLSARCLLFVVKHLPYNVPVSRESLRDFCFAKFLACFYWPLTKWYKRPGWRGLWTAWSSRRSPCPWQGGWTCYLAGLSQHKPAFDSKQLGNRFGCYSWPSEAPPDSWLQVPFDLVENVAVPICTSNVYVPVHGDKWPSLGQEFRSPQCLVWVVPLADKTFQSKNWK